MNHVFDIQFARDHSHDTLTEADLFPGAYPGFGLFAPMEHLESVYPSIKTWPIEHQREYADAICQKFCLNQSFIDLMIVRMNEEDPTNADDYNATSVGNLALLTSMNPNNVLLKERYDQMYPSIWKSIKSGIPVGLTAGLIILATYIL